MEFKGKHYVASFYDCKNIEDTNFIKSVIHTALTLAHCTIVGYTDYTFDNNGFTAVFLLSESHCSVHSYPENQSLFIDLFTCGEKADTQCFHQVLVELFETTNYQFQILHRD